MVEEKHTMIEYDNVRYRSVDRISFELVAIHHDCQQYSVFDRRQEFRVAVHMDEQVHWREFYFLIDAMNFRMKCV